MVKMAAPQWEQDACNRNVGYGRNTQESHWDLQKDQLLSVRQASWLKE